jgi:hypothetical protein
LKTVVEWWFPLRGQRRGSPPLPASSRPDRPLSILRADWSKLGDLIAVDHRKTGPVSAFELLGLGRTWLGPTWSAGGNSEAATPGRPTRWISNPSADLTEWSFRLGESRVVRTALLLRGRRLALLADQVEGKSPDAEMRVGIREGIEVVPSAEDRGLSLSSGARGPSPRVFPLGLSSQTLPVGRAAFRREANALVLRQPMEGKRAWLPLLVSWEPRRDRKAIAWRSLTVSEGSKICPAETAVAYRISWGRDESLVIYRSLARPMPRAFLGHQTRTRFLVGIFSRQGDVEPIVKVEE